MLFLHCLPCCLDVCRLLGRCLARSSPGIIARLFPARGEWSGCLVRSSLGTIARLTVTSGQDIFCVRRCFGRYLVRSSLGIIARQSPIRGHVERVPCAFIPWYHCTTHCLVFQHFGWIHRAFIPLYPLHTQSRHGLIPCVGGNLACIFINCTCCSRC